MGLKKIALLIGNAAYPDNLLVNPINDAIDLTAKLKLLGFHTISGTNTNRESFDRLLIDFQNSLSNFDVGLFFFAGHGMQIDGENFLACIDTNFIDEISAKHSSAQLNRIIDILDKGTNRTSIIILDACRNNPYERAWHRGINQLGLAPVYAPRGTIIAFATSPGEKASDGKGSNGAYTSALLKHIDEQNLSIEEMFKRVRNTVSVITHTRQTSWEHTSLMGGFCFNSSIPDEQNIAVYSDLAKEDATFLLNDTLEVHKFIKKLKSHDWNYQNPAIDCFDTFDFSNADKDTLFVLGRNLYQVSCGPSNSGKTFIQNLPSHLENHLAEISFHILNGILFEIYFDSSSLYRRIPKLDSFNEVIALEDIDKFCRSFQFIQSELKPHDDVIFYMPGSKQQIFLDISTKRNAEANLLIQGIHFEGENILFENTKDFFYHPGQETTYRSISKKQLKTDLSTLMIIPLMRLKLNFDVELEDYTKVYFPNEHTIAKMRL